VITTWKDSNSFFAAAIFAAAVAPAGGCALGRNLLCGRGDPDLGGGCGTGCEQSDEQGEHLHG